MTESQETTSDLRPLSEKPLGYLLATGGGILGGPIGLIVSPVVLLILNNAMKPLGEKVPNRFRTWALIGIVAAPISISIFTGINPDSDNISKSDSQSSVSNESSSASTSVSAPKPPAPRKPSLTGSQRNAVRSAKNYLSFSGFSKNGLIQQLSSQAGEGYSISDATTAVNTLNIDWNKQAVKSAKNYLSFSGFSCQGLITQLSSQAGDKYTVAEATYGANQTDACN